MTLFKPALKFIKYHDIRAVNFTGIGLHDDNLRMLASYLKRNPNLRSLVLDSNPFSDEGLLKIVEVLKRNSKLTHLSIKKCENVTNDSV